MVGPLPFRLKENGNWSKDKPNDPIIFQPKPFNPTPFKKFFYPDTQSSSSNESLDPALPSLSILHDIDRLYIRQQTDFQEIFCGLEKRNEYQILDNEDKEIWRATEETDFCTRICTTPILRPFDLVVRDCEGRSILNLVKGYNDCCCSQSMEIYCGQRPSILLGRVEQQFTFRGRCSQFKIFDGDGEHQLNIKGPNIGLCFLSCCTCSCGQDKDFEIENIQSNTSPVKNNSSEREIVSGNEGVVGKISKKSSDCSNQINMDKFEISFPKELSIKLKATILGAAFLIDFIYFEYFEHERVVKTNRKLSVFKY